jgi:PAS domain S-box-containing protein
MLWRKNSNDTRELAAEIKNLQSNLKRLESENRQLSGQVAIFKSARDFMNLLFYGTPACVLITDDKGHIIKANRRMQDLIGFTDAELVGKHTVEITARPEEIIKTQEDAFERKARKEDIANFESLLKHRDGTEVPVFSDITFIQDENGRHLGAVAVVRTRT